ncbi:hypothetical protein Patl1_18651 [Pistacia atlantica]|uniref:Uncharacterized protein n=1 Tax=Pistacia atlantica TaxID=434234 RepID=A0ACC1BXR1_9ROSI|nr:hypothetical protein Patl1_18651 [Pistacia atlantica]
MAESGEEPQQQQQSVMKECMHKTKTIQFFGRTTPIILQNDNGPCPLLAICNVLLLKNDLKLSPDTGEVSQEKLLALVADRLIESNSNVNMQNKDAGYVENQEQNIADAIDLLPRLATGIDVNIKFRRIDDFEFTRECAIFDLLDIPLYHGWIVDPQDYDTAIAIGSKSYNSLMGELVALETMGGESKSNSEEDCIDFAAATTATLGVPSPCLSKTKSFDDSPHSTPDQSTGRKGDLEEEEELSRVLKLSETEMPISLGDSRAPSVSGVTMSISSDESTCSKKILLSDTVHTLEGHNGDKNQSLHPPEASMSDNFTALSNQGNNNLASFESVLGREACSASKTDGSVMLDQSSKITSVDHILCNNLVEKSGVETLVQVEEAVSLSAGKDAASMVETHVDISQGDAKVDNLSASATDVHEPADNLSWCSTEEVSCLSVPNADSDSSSGRIQHTDLPETFTSSVDDSEPIYEGEECILDSGTGTYGDREPVYEGEVILAEQADKSTSDAARSKDEITPQQGELIKNFLKNNASQLTFYGLFCLQDGLKERELCVFFRNNHFSTMFKYDGELYLLATDQGYINQPDLVWEKLNEVNGDTLFMTGNFKEFKVESHANDPWDEHGAMASTADYLASIDTAAQAGLDMNSDLQLAIALQQQEFEQQPQHSNSQPPPTSGSSRLITGPQVARNGGRNSLSSTPKPDTKSKEKCSIM